MLLVFIDTSRSSEVKSPMQKNQDVLDNSEMLNKKVLPYVKHLLKDNGDGDRQKFLRLINGLEIDGYKIVDG